MVEPYLHHLCLTPAHLAAARSGNLASSPPPRSPYTPHILTLLVVSFFPLLFILHLPWFPIREVCLFGGLAPILFAHPYVQALLPVLVPTLVKLSPVLLDQAATTKDHVLRVFGWTPEPKLPVEDANAPPVPFATVLQRVIDDDRLSDDCWNSEMRVVELWENERYGGPMPSENPSLAISTSAVVLAAPQKGWSKQNLRANERSAWTRGRDGWSGVGTSAVAGTGGNAYVEAGGEVRFVSPRFVATAC